MIPELRRILTALSDYYHLDQTFFSLEEFLLGEYLFKYFLFLNVQSPALNLNERTRLT